MNFDKLMRRVTILIVLICLGSLAATARAQQVEPRPVRKGTKYKVKIDSAPQRAAVYLEDKKYGIVGYTPWEGSLVKGQWKVIVELEGYEPSERFITVNRTRSVQETFIPLVKKNEPAKIDVRADADRNAFGAEVWIDGQLQGQIPSITQTTDGRHLVEIKKEGFEVFTQWVEVKEGERITVNPFLRAIQKAKKGSILVEADVPGAEVYIDGNKHPDATPTLINDVLEGPHVIEVRKDPAIPWKQTINVVANQSVKVSAALKATIGGPGGTVRVLSNVDGARVFLDGTEMGASPIDIKDVKVGEHVIEVKAKGYQVREERVTVGAGSATVLKLDLNPVAATADIGTIKVVSPVPEAEVFIDGERIGNVPQAKDVSVGEHFVVVTKAGFKKFEQKLSLESGQTLTVTAELRAVGSLRVLSTPSAAEVLINGEPVGATPLVKEDVDVGDAVITVRYANYYDFEQQVKIEGGQRAIVTAKLESIDIGPTLADLEREQRGLTSFGARTLSRGRSTVDFGIGYPYYLDTRITVGAGRLSNFGFDAGVGFRSYASRSELSLHGRLMLANSDPFSAAAFSSFGYSSNFFDDSRRGGVTFDAGIMASLTALTHVTITGRAYLDFWTDRHCPEIKNGEFDGDPIQVCKDYKARALDGGDPAGFTVEDQMTVEDLIGASAATDLFAKRENGARFMTSVIIEAAIRQHWNVWALFEGAPFQGPRAAYTDYFSASMLKEDFGTYFRLGSTFKF